MVILRRIVTVQSPLLAKGEAERLQRISLRAALQKALLLAMAWLPLNAAAFMAEEYAIKAAFLYNFAKFIEWPPTAFAADSDPLRICVVGDNPFGAALTNLRDKRVGQREVEVQEAPAGGEARDCHIAFISRSEQPRLKSLLRTLSNRPVLTVSDIEGFAQAGGVIGLIEAEQQIRFAINTAAARRAHLQLSSQLLKLALLVDEN